MRKTAIHLISTCMLFSCNSPQQNQHPEEIETPFYLLVGTYAAPEEEGIHVYTFDENSGESGKVSSLKGISNPSYLQPSKGGNFIYAVAEDDNEEAAANALAFDKSTGMLTFLNAQKTMGGAPCYINTDKDGRFVVTANYTGGNMTVFPLDDKGELLPASQIFSFSGTGEDPERQEQPHLHCVVFSPTQEFLYGVDLGTDAIHSFQVNQDPENDRFLLPGTPSEYNVEAGSGPRHITFHPNGKQAYLINELSGRVTGFDYENNTLKPFQYIAADTLYARGSADIHSTPDGKFLYASNRLQGDGLAIFSIDPESGGLKKIGYQKTGIHPRNFIITPNGKYLLVACRDSHLIQIFEINPEDGLLTDTGNTIRVNNPVCLKFVK